MQFDYTNGTINIKNINISALGQIDLANNRIINGPTLPLTANEYVTKTYVDSMALGLGPKNAVFVKTTAADLAALAGTYTAAGSGVGKTLTKTTNGALPNIDGVAPTVGSRVLFAHSAPSDANYGIYDVTSLGSGGSPWILTRSTDCDNSPGAEVVTGIYTLVESGTTHGTTGWCLTTSGTITIDVTAQTWAQITAAGAASSLDGLTDAATDATNINLGNTAVVPAGTNNMIISKNWTQGATTSGVYNIIFGNNSGNGITSGSYNLMIGGLNASTALTTGSSNVMIGYQAGTALNGNASENTILGYNAGTILNTGTMNTLIGSSVGNTLTFGGQNILIGRTANVPTGGTTGAVVIGASTTAVGNNTLTFSSTLAANTIAAGANQRLAVFNTTTGQLAGLTDGTAGQAITTNGSGTLSWTTVSGGATALDGLSDVATSTTNINLGNTTVVPGGINCLILSKNWTKGAALTGDENIIIGNTSGNAITTGVGNILIGFSVGGGLIDGSSNVFIGRTAGQNVSSGTQNILIGTGSGAGITTGLNNICIGINANSGATAANGRISIGTSVTAAVDNAVFFSTTLATTTTAADTANNYSVVFVGNTGRLASCAKDADIGATIDSTTGTAGAAPYTLNASADATANNNFAKIAAELNAIRNALRNHGIMS